jgi:hypothetical protein
MMEYTNSHPKQRAPIPEVSGWFVTTAYFAATDALPRESVRNPLGPEFMAPRAAKRIAPWRSAWHEPKRGILGTNHEQRRILEVNHEEDRTFCK